MPEQARDASRPTRTFWASALRFAVVLLVAHLAAHLLYAQVVLSTSINQRVDRAFWPVADRVQVLALGDSHVQRGFAAELIPDAYNFASAGENWYFTAYKLDAILERAGAPELVVLPVDPHAFVEFESPATLDDVYWRQYVDYRELARRTGDRRLLTEWARASFFSYVGNGRRVAEAMRARLLGAGARIESGHLRIERRFSELPAEERTRRARRRADFHFRDETAVSPAMVEAFERVIATLGEHGARVVLVEFPLGREYLAAIPVGVETSLDDAIRGVGTRHPNVALYMSARRLLADAPELFEDQDHLNVEGSARFTGELIAAMESRGLLER